MLAGAVPVLMVCYTGFTLPTPVTNAITNRIKLLGRYGYGGKAQTARRRIKTVSANGEEIELRLSTMPTAFGEKLVMRIFDPENSGKKLCRSGLLTRALRLWHNWTSQPHGIIWLLARLDQAKPTTCIPLETSGHARGQCLHNRRPIEMVELHLPDAGTTKHRPELCDVCAPCATRSDIIMVGEIVI